MESSCTILVATTRKPSFLRMSATAGPETSVRSPREQESLTVTTAALKAAGTDSTVDLSVIEFSVIESSVIKEDIFLLFPGSPARCSGGGSAYVSRGTCAGTDSGTGGILCGLRAAFAL